MFRMHRNGAALCFFLHARIAAYADREKAYRAEENSIISYDMSRKLKYTIEKNISLERERKRGKERIQIYMKIVERH